MTNLDASAFLGRLALVRIHNGTLRKGQQVSWCREVDGEAVVERAKITELLATVGVDRAPAEMAVAGDIVAVAGMPEIMIGDTLADLENPVALPRISVDEPAISVTIGTNSSPLAGRVSGHKLTARMVKQRLDTELIGNVSLRVLDIGRPDAWEVQGRGELALAILVEQMRREGFELTVGKPQVVTRKVDGKVHEPFEHLTVDVPEEYLGAVTQLLAARKGRMEHMNNHGTAGCAWSSSCPRAASSGSAPTSSPRPAAPVSPTPSSTATTHGPARSGHATPARWSATAPARSPRSR